MHEVLVNRLGGLSLPRKSVVRLTDRPDMTLDVYPGRKTTIQQQQQPMRFPPLSSVETLGKIKQSQNYYLAENNHPCNYLATVDAAYPSYHKQTKYLCKLCGPMLTAPQEQSNYGLH